MATNDEPTLKDIRELIDGLAITAAKNFAELNTKVDGLSTKFRDLKGDMGEVKERLDRIERKLDHHETRIEALEAK